MTSHEHVAVASIGRAIEDVFDWATTPGRWPEYTPTALSIDADEPMRPVREGDRFREHVQVGLWRGYFDWTVETVERPHRCVFVGRGGDASLLSRLAGQETARIEYELSTDGRWTRLTRRAAYSVGHLAAILGDLDRTAPSIAEAADVAMQTLASILENPYLHGPQPDAAAESLQFEADPLADEAVASLVSPSGDCSALDLFLDRLYRGDPPPDDVPPPMRRFLEATATLPSWACPPRMTAASDVFFDWGALAIAAHLGASLPETYVMPRSAKLLNLTHQLDGSAKAVDRRLWFTVRMVIDLLAINGLAPGGRGLLALQRLRLIHATIRLFVQHRLVSAQRLSRLSSDALWDSENGLPLSQLDLLQTQLTFSAVIVRSFDLFQCGLTPYQREAYVHLWNVAGALLGIRPELLPRNAADAARIFDTMKARYFEATPDAAALGHALIGFWNSLLPVMSRTEGQKLYQAVVARLLTPETIRANGLDQLPAFTPDALKAIEEVTGCLDREYSDVLADASIVRHIAAALISLVMKTVSSPFEDKSGMWDIPATLREQWARASAPAR